MAAGGVNKVRVAEEKLCSSRRQHEVVHRTLVEVNVNVVQVRLISGDTRLTCWVDTAKRFRVGDALTLKKLDGRKWRVLSISQPRDASLINTDWKVGGLS